MAKMLRSMLLLQAPHAVRSLLMEKGDGEPQHRYPELAKYYRELAKMGGHPPAAFVAMMKKDAETDPIGVSSLRDYIYANLWLGNEHPRFKEPHSYHFSGHTITDVTGLALRGFGAPAFTYKLLKAGNKCAGLIHYAGVQMDHLEWIGGDCDATPGELVSHLKEISPAELQFPPRSFTLVSGPPPLHEEVHEEGAGHVDSVMGIQANRAKYEHDTVTFYSVVDEYHKLGFCYHAKFANGAFYAPESCPWVAPQ